MAQLCQVSYKAAVSKLRSKMDAVIMEDREQALNDETTTTYWANASYLFAQKPRSECLPRDTEWLNLLAL